MVIISFSAGCEKVGKSEIDSVKASLSEMMSLIDSAT